MHHIASLSGFDVQCWGRWLMKVRRAPPGGHCAPSASPPYFLRRKMQLFLLLKDFFFFFFFLSILYILDSLFRKQSSRVGRCDSIPVACRKTPPGQISEATVRFCSGCSHVAITTSASHLRKQNKIPVPLVSSVLVI